ncbi:uncharacterized protein K452DRAFT_303545 [Neofusicoccum parvum]|nr:uncharacterized protein K452DRAFT_303545 [Neofusicoccum parvum]
MRDSPPSSAEEDTVHYKLRLNRDSLAVVAGFLACDAPHEFPLIILAYVFVRKIAATFARALYMPCDAVFHFGTYTIEGEDRHALRRRIILIGVRKIKQMLGQLALKTQARRSSADGWVLEDCESVYRPICVFLQSFVRKEIDGIIKHIDDIES